MIVTVDSTKSLRQFVYFIKTLYKDNPHYVFPLFKVQMKELKKAVLADKDYTAILSVEQNEVRGRLLYTYSTSKDKDEKICFFSFFDAVDDMKVAKELFDRMESDMKRDGITYAEGTYTPYDPDTRRGVLVNGFDIDPTLFTSYNYQYYQKLIEHCGYRKKIDTVSLGVNTGHENGKLLKALAAMFFRRHDVTIRPLDYSKLDQQIDAIHHILQKATNELVYQEAPSIEMVRNVAKNLKLFINPDFIPIAFENNTGEPIGFCLALPDFNQLFKKTKGRIKPIYLLLNKQKINKVRGILQYVVPKYQGTGLIGALFNSIYENFPKYGITEFEAGTMLENNLRPIKVFQRLGGKIIKTYRIFGKDLNQNGL